jgi:GNAT superfamily N-acetyltransferase
MTLEDIRPVTILAEQLGYPNTQEDIEKRFLQIINQPQYALFVAKSDLGDVLGWIQINIEPMSLLVSSQANVAAFIVDEKCRGQNIGKALLARAEEWANEKGVMRIRIRSNLIRHDAHRFYQREGYEVGKTSNVFVKHLVY